MDWISTIFVAVIALATIGYLVKFVARTSYDVMIDKVGGFSRKWTMNRRAFA